MLRQNRHLARSNFSFATLTIWINFSGNLKRFRRGQINVSRCDSQDNTVGITDVLENKMPYLIFNI